MISLKNGTLTQEGRTEPIIGFSTKWAHPFHGLYDKLEEAVKACEGFDFEPEEVLRPITVAFSANLTESLIR